MTTATIGSRFQVVIPVRERRKIGLKPHQKVLVEERNNEIIIRPIGGQSFRGITRDMHANEDPVDYVAKLRSEWGQRL